MWTRPTGLVSVAPVGPAMPVTPRPMVAPVRSADAFGEGFGDFGRDGAVLGDEFGGDAGEGGLERVGVDDGSAEKRARAAGDDW